MKAKTAALIGALAFGAFITASCIVNQISSGQLPPNVPDPTAPITPPDVLHIETPEDALLFIISRNGRNTILAAGLSFDIFTRSSVGGNSASMPLVQYGLPGFIITKMTVGEVASSLAGTGVEANHAYVDCQRAIYWDGNAWEIACYSLD
jgi:hypothetical protein